jgi:conjugal transfer pilus assembly protein TraE
MKSQNYLSEKAKALLALGVDRLITLGAVLLAVLCLVLVVTRETIVRTVLVPPSINRVMWVEQDKASSEYLEEMALFISTLVFNVSPGSVDFQGEQIKRYICPEGYGAIDSLVRQGADRLKRDSATTIFGVRQIKTEPLTKRVTLTGQKSIFIAERRVTDQQQTYVLDFENKTGKLCVKAIYEQLDKNSSNNSNGVGTTSAGTDGTDNSNASNR